MSKRHLSISAVTLSCALAVLSTFGAGSAGAAAKASATPHRGGSLAVIIAPGAYASWPTLDPAVAASSLYDRGADIYGELIAQGPNGTYVPGLATSWSFADKNLLFKMILRKNVKFSDGTSFNAAAVQWNLQRDFSPATACGTCTNFSVVSSVTTSGNYEVDLHLKQSYAPLLAAFIGTAPDFIVSPTAFQKEGAGAFGVTPVGAGPFMVQSNTPSNTLVLTRNPNYYLKGEPYLNTLTYESTGGDQPAISALQSGSAQIAQGVTTPSDLLSAKQDGLVDSKIPATGDLDLQFDTFAAPMNNLKAREAVAYATNAKAVVAGLYDGLVGPAETPTAPGTLFYTPKISEYKGYNLAKAKQLVASLGGSLQLKVIMGSQPISLETVQILEQYWQQAGITVTQATQAPNITALIGDYAAHTYSLALGNNSGNVDPSVTLTTFYAGNGSASMLNDPVVNHLFVQAQGLINPAARSKAMAQLFKTLIGQVYTDPLFSNQAYYITTPKVENIAQGIATPHFATVWLKS